MAIKNIIAGGIGFSPGSTKFIPTLGFSIGAVVAITWTDVATFLFVAADWLITSFKLRAHLKATSGTVYARIFDETTSTQTKIISTTDTNLAFVTSSAMTLTDGDEYTVQFGAGTGIDCIWESFDVFQGAD